MGRKSLGKMALSATLQVRLTEATKAEVDRRGGAEWVRSLIDAALPAAQTKTGGVAKKERRSGQAQRVAD